MKQFKIKEIIPKMKKESIFKEWLKSINKGINKVEATDIP